MRILIIGAGKMGTFFCDLLSFDHTVAIIDRNPERLRFTFNAERFSDPRQVADFKPDLVINAATVKYTVDAFRQVLPYLPAECMLADIASVKTGLPEFYAACGHRFVSTHPMFGPTFASLANLANENAIVISEGDEEGRRFFLDLYKRLGLHIEEYTFAEHDETIAYSLSIPFASTLAFGAVMKHQSAPGTTFKRHLAIVRGLLNEDDFLLTEILFNPLTTSKLTGIIDRLTELRDIVNRHDPEAMLAFINDVRARVLGPADRH